MSKRSKIVLVVAVLSLIVGFALTFTTLIGIYSCADSSSATPVCTDETLWLAKTKVDIGSILVGLGFVGLAASSVLAIFDDKKSKRQHQ